MAIKPDWTLGTLTLTAGSTAFTTTGSALKAADIQGGDTLITQSGAVLVIATITGENSGTLYMPCPPLTAGVNQPLRVRYQGDASRLPAATRHLLNELSSGNIAAFAELVGQADMVPIFTGAGMLTLVSTEMVGGGGAGSWQATVVLLSGRDAYDGKEAGFRVMVIDNGTGRSAIYQKTSSAAADWSEPMYFTGPVGKQGIAATLKIGTVITGAAGSAAEVINTGTEQDAVLTLKLPAGDIGQTGPANSLRIGIVQVGDEAAAQITGEAPSQVLNLTLPIGPIGPDGKAAAIKIGTVTLAPHGTVPSITNSGNEREAVLDFIIPSGKDGTGTGDMQARDYDPSRKGVDAFDMANMAEAENSKIMTAEERQDIANAKRDRHTHDNKQVLDNTTESFTTPLKNKLDNLPANANQTNTATVGAALAAAAGEQSISDADSVAGVQSGTSNARRWTWGIVKAWIKGWITKADVGLGRVDNTPDASKPISQDVQTALDSKASYNWIINGDFTINQRGSVKKPANGVYGFDRWKGHANGIEQIIEALPAGEYTLTWSGGGNGIFGGQTKASPIKATVAGGNTSVVVPQTATRVSVVAGDLTTRDPWINVGRSVNEETLLCVRFFRRLSNVLLGPQNSVANNLNRKIVIAFDIPLRVTPTVAFAQHNDTTGGNAENLSPTSLILTGNVNASGTWGGFIWVTVDAEL